MRVPSPRFVALAMAMLTVAAAARQAALTPEQQREFLRTARVVEAQPIGRGVTGSLRLTLSDGITTHDAAFQSIDDRASMEDRRQGRRRAGEVNFTDSYKYNVAAYEIARLLGLDDMMPVTVERSWQGRRGSLTWWVDDVLMDEAGRAASNARPPSPLDFQRQRMRMAVFAELVGDVDRNQGNVLYTRDWRVIMIDFTRAFRLHHALREPRVLLSIERNLWQRLQQVSRADLERATGVLLTLEEVGALSRRREAMVEHYTRLIRERGEAVVVY